MPRKSRNRTKNNNNAKSSNQQPQRNRGRRTRQGKGNNIVANSSGTTSAVQTRLRVQNNGAVSTKVYNTKIVDIPYARCRLNPFAASGSGGIPDLCAAGKLVFDHRGAQDFTVNGTASIMVLPTLPFGACIKPDSSGAVITLDSTSINQATSSTLTYNWIPISFYTDAVNASNVIMDPLVNSPPNISSRLRVAGVGWRLICTSPATSISGIIEIVDSELSLEPRQINPASIVMSNPSDGAPVTYAANTVDSQFVNFASNERAAAIVSKTVQMRPEMQPQGVLKHTGPYIWGTVNESPLVMQSGGSVGNSFFTFGTGPNTNKYGTITTWDSSYNVTRIKIITPQVLSFRLETLICVEYILSPTNPYSRIATKITKNDARSVELVDTAIGVMPVAVTPAQNQSFLNKFLSLASKAAPVVGGMVGPEGLLLGTAISSVTEAIATLL